ncbi:MAG: hypothetical protein KGI38_11050 [Thaumarchaeota archaeon]|nr:hypothetical protein [Nitrososphaerota archaeon]
MKESASGGLAVLAVTALVVLAVAVAPSAHAQDSTQVRAQIGQAYAALLKAEQSGGNVTALTAQLNSAISLLHQADLVNGTDPSRAQSLYSQASSLASQVIQSAPGVASAGAASIATQQLDLGLETAVLAALAIVVYVYAPRVFWRFWLRTHRDWRVRKS